MLAPRICFSVSLQFDVICEMEVTDNSAVYPDRVAKVIQYICHGVFGGNIEER